MVHYKKETLKAKHFVIVFNVNIQKSEDQPICKYIRNYKNINPDLKNKLIRYFTIF